MIRHDGSHDRRGDDVEHGPAWSARYRRSNSRGRGSGEIPVLQQEPLISEIVAESGMNGLLSADRHFGRNADGPLEWLCCLAPLLRDACWLRFFQLRGEFGICHARSACEITRGPSFSRRSSSILAVSSARKRSSQSRSRPRATSRLSGSDVDAFDQASNQGTLACRGQRGPAVAEFSGARDEPALC